MINYLNSEKNENILKYSLLISKNYHKNNKNNIKQIINKYFILIKHYIFLIFEKIKIMKNIEKYNIICGFEIINNIFLLLILYTNNLELVYHHTNKSIYFYIEFIEQMLDEKNEYLDLKTLNATLFVYNKIFSEINKKYKPVILTDYGYIKTFGNILKLILINQININYDIEFLFDIFIIMNNKLSSSNYINIDNFYDKLSSELNNKTNDETKSEIVTKNFIVNIIEKLVY